MNNKSRFSGLKTVRNTSTEDLFDEHYRLVGDAKMK